MKICTVSKMAAQGDVLFRRVNSIPDDAKKATGVEASTVAHSETGHNHVVEGKDFSVFLTSDPMVSYVRVDSEYADVVHRRAWDTHGTLRLLKGDWEIRRQREETPDGWKMVMD